MADEFKDVDLYELFGVLQSATSEEVKKAYRKKALKCHPDKNPDNPKAAEEFQKLTRALEILLDTSARAVYDRVINAKKAAKLRHQELDSRRKKFKEELEAREREAEQKGRYGSYSTKTDEEKLQAEIERLRKDGSKQLEEEIELVRQQIQREMQSMGMVNPINANAQSKRIKVRWAAEKGDDTNGGYNEENLNKIFSKYGDIEIVIVSKKKNGSALVEFESSDPARKAEMLEKGYPNNPLRVELIAKEPVSSGTQSAVPVSSQFSTPSSNINTKRNTERNTDFESLVMRQMRQAEERKRLIEQMKKEDEDT